jgi:selenobiotic family peptide radical SAM maturase
MELERHFPGCRSLVGSDTWRGLIAAGRAAETPEAFLETLRSHCRSAGAPAFLPELALLEWHLWNIAETALTVPDPLEAPAVNPSLYLLELPWKNLDSFSGPGGGAAPEPGAEILLLWKHPEDGRVRVQAAAAEDLLVLKMIAEEIDRKEVARAGALPIAAVDAALERAADKGIVLLPPSGIRRDPDPAGLSPLARQPFLASPTFTLQWHITQACDLHCRHCYDRSDRTTLSLAQATGILDDMEGFCRRKQVRGQISFSGGNPLLHPDFAAIYQAAADRGFTASILGNPAPRAELEALIAIQPPGFFQVSLEGMREYNDYIRGEGHFDRVLDFLALLRELKVYSMVMLTLTGDNIGQVLPLGELLRDRTDAFFFNRLAKVGEGAALELPARDEYASFLGAYLAAARENPVLGLKDNLLNIPLHRQGEEPFGGCTGFGCGAAFNFLALLSDGEVHACRKFPSAIGNVFAQGIEAIYASDLARRYRSGCEACRPCPLRPVCGGCLASAYSCGLDIFTQKDPFCFV